MSERPAPRQPRSTRDTQLAQVMPSTFSRISSSRPAESGCRAVAGRPAIEGRRGRRDQLRIGIARACSIRHTIAGPRHRVAQACCARQAAVGFDNGLAIGQADFGARTPGTASAPAATLRTQCSHVMPSIGNSMRAIRLPQRSIIAGRTMHAAFPTGGLHLLVRFEIGDWPRGGDVTMNQRSAVSARKAT